jgi:hypothetical protein
MSSGDSQAISKINAYSHKAIVDLIIADPGITQNELAAHFGYTPGWISQILRSDAMQEQLAERKAELTDPVIIASLEKQMEALAGRSMTVLMEKLDLPNVSVDVALKALDITSRALGYGAKAANANVQVNNYVVAMPQKEATADGWAQRHNPRLASTVTIDTVIDG